MEWFKRLLKDDSGEPSPKLHAGLVGMILFAALVIGHMAGKDYQEFVYWGVVTFTAACFSISELGRLRKK